jgi:hypothetical protein
LWSIIRSFSVGNIEVAFSLRADFWDVGDKITLEENRALQAPFMEEEVRAAVFNCYLEGSPGPDGIPFLFFQKF